MHIFTARVSELELESLEKLDSEVLEPTFVDLQFSWKVIPMLFCRVLLQVRLTSRLLDSHLWGES